MFMFGPSVTGTGGHFFNTCNGTGSNTFRSLLLCANGFKLMGL